MESMPRPRPLHLLRERSRHGRWVWYVRIGKGPRIRVRGEYGSEAFQAAYRAAISGEALPVASKPLVNSLEWLIARYRDSGAWLVLSKATRRQRENIFRHVVESSGGSSCTQITPQAIIAGRERRAHTPAQARNFLDAMRGLFAWATEAQHVRTDPTIGVKNPPRKKGPGFKA